MSKPQKEPKEKEQAETAISVSYAIRDRIQAHGSYGDTYNSILKRILDRYEDYMAILDACVEEGYDLDMLLKDCGIVVPQEEDAQE